MNSLRFLARGGGDRDFPTYSELQLQSGVSLAHSQEGGEWGLFFY